MVAVRSRALWDREGLRTTGSVTRTVDRVSTRTGRSGGCRAILAQPNFRTLLSKLSQKNQDYEKCDAFEQENMPTEKECIKEERHM